MADCLSLRQALRVSVVVHYSLTLNNQLTDIAHLNESIESFSIRAGLNQRLSLQMKVVLDEIVGNIIKYGFTDNRNSSGKINVEIAISSDTLILIVTDNARFFNPLTQSRPDLSSNPENRELGGLGIYIVGKIMDEMQYQRIDGKNVLTLSKSIPDESVSGDRPDSKTI